MGNNSPPQLSSCEETIKFVTYLAIRVGRWGGGRIEDSPLRSTCVQLTK
jgi:hypothetical protein